MGKTFHCWRQYGHQSTSLQLTYNLQEQAPAKEENMALTNRTLILCPAMLTIVKPPLAAYFTVYAVPPDGFVR